MTSAKRLDARIAKAVILGIRASDAVTICRRTDVNQTAGAGRTVNSMTPEERANILNDIEWMLEEKGYKYTVCGYEDKEEADMFVVLLQKDGNADGV